MVRTIVQRPYDNSISYFEFAGLETDTKPKAGVMTGSKFTEVDTGLVFMYDESGSGTWEQFPPATE